MMRVMILLDARLLDEEQRFAMFLYQVDAGIGGRVAEIVGKMLKQFGTEHHVMCITHLPQVAASADEADIAYISKRDIMWSCMSSPGSGWSSSRPVIRYRAIRYSSGTG